MLIFLSRNESYPLYLLDLCPTNLRDRKFVAVQILSATIADLFCANQRTNIFASSKIKSLLHIAVLNANSLRMS